MSESEHSLVGIHVYPVKACRGISVPRARVTDRGLEHDRRWMVCDREGRFLSQRERAQLCLVTVGLHEHGYLLEAPRMQRLLLPFSLSEGEGERGQATVWSSLVWGYRHADGSRWFSEYLGETCQLLHMPDTSHRRVSGRDRLVSFADGYPLLMISQASLDELNRRLQEPMTMERFRPNLVVSGGPPHFEDTLDRFSIGRVPFEAPKLCERCVVTTLDPETGTAGREPLRTLASYRRWDGKVWFGTNLIAEREGTLALGQELGEVVLRPRYSRR